MKIIYKVKTAHYENDERMYFFDTYDQVKDWLEEHFGKQVKLQELEINTMMSCDSCGEYDEPTCYSFIKSDYNTLMTYCLKCAPNYKIDKKPFMKEENYEEKR